LPIRTGVARRQGLDGRDTSIERDPQGDVMRSVNKVGQAVIAIFGSTATGVAVMALRDGA